MYNSLVVTLGILYEQNLQPGDALVCYKKAVDLSRNMEGKQTYSVVTKDVLPKCRTV